MSQKEIIIESEADLGVFARDIADQSKSGDIYLLQGDLGAGKSTFSRAFIRHLSGAEIDVPSPTFTLVQQYDTHKGLIWHFDLYRLEDADEIYEIGWEEALSDGILLVEWPQRLGSLVPPQAKTLNIEITGDETRKITYKE